jgi:uncharacterized protein
MALDFDQLRPRIAALCRRYRVRRLEAFGSAVSDDFDHASSDVDLMVEFAETSPVGAADRYFGLHGELEQVLGRHVDLIVRGAVSNPYFLEAADRKRLNLYAA